MTSLVGLTNSLLYNTVAGIGAFVAFDLKQTNSDVVVETVLRLTDYWKRDSIVYGHRVFHWSWRSPF